MPSSGPHSIWPQKGAQPRRWSRSHRATENFQLNGLLRDPNPPSVVELFFFKSIFCVRPFLGCPRHCGFMMIYGPFLTRGHHRVANPTIFMTMNRSSFVGVQEKLDTMRMVVYSNQKHVDLTNMWT